MGLTMSDQTVHDLEKIVEILDQRIHELTAGEVTDPEAIHLVKLKDWVTKTLKEVRGNTTCHHQENSALP